ncbi:lipid A deacylase LpxR family protein [Helicobacter kayseriensis]|uniref:lipid A deacylase LpxR family protein n=1 Tax=Helicobacter kayseriensis TaxID=2905877 RepID=UPI001E651A8C|nr:lipid A deacylase LpxR family protein [Helicobacter kayseriensis]MCE3046777.1 lipid A deacylase LpxR family protein [Helicobacter kayseriensis]MCE3047921.1 lipid A deacylase LpxR family protein [Helicobacter kayseriensis]
MNKRLFGFFFSLGILLQAQPYEKHFLSFITQNDAYVDSMIDRYYTAGHSLTYASKEGDYGWLNTFGFISGETSFSLQLSQSIYAPKNKFDLYPPLDDHPYAGFLSFIFGIHHRQENMLEGLGIRIGIAGKMAMGKQAQDAIHTALDVGLLSGWMTQIQNEWIVNLYYEWSYKHFLYQSTYFDIEVSPTIELAFGNANIYGKLTTFLRLGYNLKTTFLPQGVIGENGGLQNGRVYGDGIGFFGFFGLGGSYVARKMAIEGNLFSHDPYPRNAILNHWVGHMIGGISFVSGNLSLSYMAVCTTREFRQQENLHAIGSIWLAYSF